MRTWIDKHKSNVSVNFVMKSWDREVLDAATEKLKNSIHLPIFQFSPVCKEIKSMSFEATENGKYFIGCIVCKEKCKETAYVQCIICRHWFHESCETFTAVNNTQSCTNCSEIYPMIPLYF